MAALYRTMTGQSQSSGHSDKSTQVQKTSTTDPLTGALNHLTEQQQELLEEFKTRLEKDGWWTREGVNGKPSHDDGTLLRYLRARKFDVNGAIGQFSDTEKWMKQERVEELYEHFDVEVYEKARAMYPQWTGHRDRRGIPLYVYVIKHLDSKNVSKYQKLSQEYKATLPYHKSLSTPAKLLPLFALYHNLLGFVLPLCSTLERANPEVPVTNSTNIVDISGVGLTQFWNLKAHMQDASVLATAHYPETLDRIFIIGAPAFFPTVWGWIKRWFDPVTVSKIFILGKHEVKSTLSSFIEAKDFPKRYGGELEWEFGDLPKVDEETKAVLEKDGVKGWVRGPALWLNHERVIVGSEKGKLRRPDKEVAQKKPIVYAADYTEEPVHQDRKGSLTPQRKTPSPDLHTKTNGTIHLKKTEVKAAAAVTAAASTAVAVEQQKSRPKTPSTPNVPKEDVRSTPFEGSPVHLPKTQPGFPEQTAEYMSSESVALQQPSSVESKLESPTSEARSPAATTETKVDATSSAPPPGMTQPGPPSTHQYEMSRAIVSKMEGESVSTIPASGADAALPHPELTIVSDPTKGLAIETEKLVLASSLGKGASPAVNGAVKPPLERFSTAAEF